MSNLGKYVVTKEWDDEDEEEEGENEKEYDEDDDCDEYVISGEMVKDSPSDYPLFKIPKPATTPKAKVTVVSKVMPEIRERNNSTNTVLVRNAIQEPKIYDLIKW